MSRLKNIRIGDIEARVSGTDEYAYEIVKWYANDLYNKQDDYIYISQFDKYTKDGSNTYYDPSCFLSKEHYYVLCWVTDSDEPDIHAVGMRPFDLEEDDNSDFMLVLRMAVKNIAESYRD